MNCVYEMLKEIGFLIERFYKLFLVLDGARK